MRSAAVFLSRKRTHGGGRVRRPASAKVRRSHLSAVRAPRRAAGQPRGAARMRLIGIAARTPLDRVRLLRVLPRGVIPYVKH